MTEIIKEINKKITINDFNLSKGVSIGAKIGENKILYKAFNSKGTEIGEVLYYSSKKLLDGKGNASLNFALNGKTIIFIGNISDKNKTKMIENAQLDLSDLREIIPSNHIIKQKRKEIFNENINNILESGELKGVLFNIFLRGIMLNSQRDIIENNLVNNNLISPKNKENIKNALTQIGFFIEYK